MRQSITQVSFLRPRDGRTLARLRYITIVSFGRRQVRQEKTIAPALAARDKNWGDATLPGPVPAKTRGSDCEPGRRGHFFQTAQRFAGTCTSLGDLAPGQTAG